MSPLDPTNDAQGRSHLMRLRRDIEGLRALAVLLVVGYHSGLPGFAGGYIGVDVFFVLSGYLITGLLVREARLTGAISVSRFYGRRARRLLPAMACMLFVTAGVGAVVYAPFEQQRLAGTALATSSYVSNVHFARIAFNYLANEGGASPFLHTWSLSVEEQFYLVWPFFVILGLGQAWRKSRPGDPSRLLWWMGGLALVSLLLSVSLTYLRLPWAFFLSPARAWEFAIGGLAWLGPRGLGDTAGQGAVRDRKGGGEVVGWLSLLGVCAAGALLDDTTPFPGVAAILPVAATAMVLKAGEGEAEPSWKRFLGLPPFQAIGRLSYSWYLWHWPMFVMAGELGLTSAPAYRIVLPVSSLCVAVASYHWVERPLRYHPWLVRVPARSLRMAGILFALGAAASLGWRQMAIRWAASDVQMPYTAASRDEPSVMASGCHAGARVVSADWDKCTSPSSPTAYTVVLFGDSHAAQWYPALREVSRRHGWRLVSVTKTSCTPFGADAVVGYPECGRWRNAVLEGLAQLRPDLVVVASSTAYPLSVEEWGDGVHALLGSLDASGTPAVVLKDTPRPGFDVPACLARHKWLDPRYVRPSCSFSALSAWNLSRAPVDDAISGAVEDYPLAASLDLNPVICSASDCSPQREGRILYRDSDHLTSTFVASLAPFVDEALARLTWPSASATLVSGESPLAEVVIR